MVMKSSGPQSTSGVNRIATAGRASSKAAPPQIARLQRLPRAAPLSPIPCAIAGLHVGCDAEIARPG